MRRPAERAVPAGGERVRVRVVRWLLVSLVLSVVVEWIGMTWVWPDEGAAHAAGILREETGYLHDDFRGAAVRIVDGADWAYYWAFEWTGIEEGLKWVASAVGVVDYALAGLLMVQVFMVRVVLLAFSAPAFALFGAVGLTSGLTLRDIRRWSAGREFGGVYHTAKRLAPRALTAAAVVYLAIPVAVHPTLVIVPGAALFGGFVMVVAASFKKYL